MTSILVVDDAMSDRTLVSGIVKKWDNSTVLEAPDGRLAMQMIEEYRPDIVLTDMHMPEMNGLELVTAVRESFPGIPIILMTAKGSEEIAALALQAGAASYVPKRRIAQDLLDTVRQVHSTSQGERCQARLMHHMTNTDTSFTLFNDRTLIRSAVDEILNMLRSLPLRDQTDRVRVGIALEEALNNACFHGNLQVRDHANSDKRQYNQIADRRRFAAPWITRRIHLRAIIDRDHVELIIRDDGPGFDWRRWMAQSDGETSGARGIALMQSIMDDVEFNDAGNQVTLRKSRFVEPDDDAE